TAVSVTVSSGSSSGSGLSSGLVGYWRMEEATGATRADSAGANSLIQFNNVAQVAGKLNNGAGFSPASSQSLGCAGNNFIFGNNSFTVAAWVKVNQQGSGDYE